MFIIKKEELNFINKNINSSYKKNNFGILFYSLVYCLKPKVCVEIGVLEGYSASFIGLALRDTGGGKLYAYDLWEKYPFKHAKLEDTQKNIDHLSLGKYIELRTKEAEEVCIEWENNSIDFIHIDISNDGSIFDKMLKMFHLKLKLGGIIIFEGGSKERDGVEWMVKFKKPKISEAIDKNLLLKEKFQFLVLEPFPSITICKKIKN